MNKFEPNALPCLIGSLPLDNHQEALEWVLAHTPEIPLWTQLPYYPEEKMMNQFCSGIPGLNQKNDEFFFKTDKDDFQDELLLFFEDYLAVMDGSKDIAKSRFAFTGNEAKGFEAFLDKISRLSIKPLCVKGQITGPFTMMTGLKDEAGRMACYNPELREAIIKTVAVKAMYQAQKLIQLGTKAMVFLDEPALAGFGSSAMVGLSAEDITACLIESVDAIHSAGAMAGVHVCANTDWSLLLSLPIDILSFDAFGFFDRIILFKEHIRRFLKDGGVIAWGIVPTLNADDLKQADTASLVKKWHNCAFQLEIDMDTVKRQAIITPSCGTGLLSRELANKALRLTRAVSEAVRTG